MGGISSRSLRRGPVLSEAPRHHNWDQIQFIPDADADSDVELEEADLVPVGDQPNWPKACPVLHLDINNDFQLEAQRRVLRSLYRNWLLVFWTLILNLVAVIASQLTSNITQPSALEISFAAAIAQLFIHFLFYFRPLYWAFRLQSNILYIWFYVMAIASIAFYTYFLIQAVSIMSIMASPLAPGSPVPVKANPIFPMVLFTIVVILFAYSIFKTFYFIAEGFKWQLMSDEKMEQIYRKERRKGWLSKFFKGNQDDSNEDGNSGYACMLEYEQDANRDEKGNQRKSGAGDRLSIPGEVVVDSHHVTFKSTEPIINHAFTIKTFFTDIVALKKKGKTEIHILEKCNPERPEEEKTQLYKTNTKKTDYDVRLLILDMKTKGERQEVYTKINNLWYQERKAGSADLADTSLRATRMRLLRQTKEREGNHLLTHKDWLTLVKFVGKMEFKAGEVIMEAGAYYDFLFYISEGTINVQIETSGFTDPGDVDSDSDVDFDEIMFPEPPSANTDAKENRIYGMGHEPDEFDELSGEIKENSIYFNVKFHSRSLGFSYRMKQTDPESSVKRAVVLTVKSGSQAKTGHLRPGDELVCVGNFNIEENEFDQHNVSKLIKGSSFPLILTFRRVFNRTDSFNKRRAQSLNAGQTEKATEEAKVEELIDFTEDNESDEEPLPRPPSPNSTIFEVESEVGNENVDTSNKNGEQTVNLLALDFAEQMAVMEDDDDAPTEYMDESSDDDEQVEFVGKKQSNTDEQGVELVDIVIHDHQGKDASVPLLAESDDDLSIEGVGVVHEEAGVVEGVSGGMTFWKGSKQTRYTRLGSQTGFESITSNSVAPTSASKRVMPIGDDIEAQGARKRRDSFTSIKSYKFRQGIIAKSRTFLFGKPFGYQEVKTVADYYTPDPQPVSDSESDDGHSFQFDQEEEPQDFDILFANVTTFETFGTYEKGDMLGVVPWVVNHPISVAQLVAAKDVVIHGILIDDLSKTFQQSPTLALAFFKYLASVLGERVDRDEEKLCQKYREDILPNEHSKQTKQQEREALRRLLDGKTIHKTTGTKHAHRIKDMMRARKMFQFRNDMEFDTLLEKFDNVSAMLTGDLVLRAGKKEWFGVDTSDIQSATYRAGALFVTSNHICFKSFKNSLQLLKFQNRPKLYGKIHINDIYELKIGGHNGEVLNMITDACRLSVLFQSETECQYMHDLIHVVRKTSSIERAPYSYTLPWNMNHVHDDDPSFLVYRQQRALRFEFMGLVEALEDVLTAQDKWRLFKDSRAVSLKRAQSILSAWPQDIKNFENVEPVGLYLVGKGEMVIQREINGRRIQFGTYKAGAIFGIERFLTGAPSPCTIKVLSKRAQLRFCPTERAMTLLRADPALAARFYQYCCLSYMLRLRGPVISRPMNEADKAIMENRMQRFEKGGCSIL